MSKSPETRCNTCLQPIHQGEPVDVMGASSRHRNRETCVSLTRAATARRCAEKARYLTEAAAEEHRFLGYDIISLIKDEFGSGQ